MRGETGHREGWQDPGSTWRPKAPCTLSFPLLLGDSGVIPRSPGLGGWGAGEDKLHLLAWPCLEAQNR